LEQESPHGNMRAFLFYNDEKVFEKRRNAMYGVCCIVLGLEEQKPPRKFQKMTYSNFIKNERQNSLNILGNRILNNIETTLEAIKFCHTRGYCYRLSSDLFPLITYDKAQIKLEDLPTYELIVKTFDKINEYISNHRVRISLHPSEFNVLASENEDALNRTIKELNFYSDFMDKIGCAKDYNSPINIHINNNQGERSKIIDRFLNGFDRLSQNCQSRIVIENDDKTACWSVRKLIECYNKRTGRPITFDFLHHKCHPDGLVEKEALELCYETWGNIKPLFHFSQSKDEKNIRAHRDYPNAKFENYGLEFDLDFEFKMKEKAIEFFESNLINNSEMVLN
jgi:UV DNA damage endonuclease